MAITRRLQRLEETHTNKSKFKSMNSPIPSSPLKLSCTDEPRRRKTALRLAQLCPLALMVVCSCKSVTYDMRRLEQPVLFNNNPCVAGKSACPVQVVNVDNYSATVSESELVASAGNTTTTQRTVANQAQVNAFNKIGGQNNRVIRGLSLDVDYLAINALLALSEKIEVRASGDVAEVRLANTNAPVTTAETKP
jgi:hypothetical protein